MRVLLIMGVVVAATVLVLTLVGRPGTKPGPLELGAPAEEAGGEATDEQAVLLPSAKQDATREAPVLPVQASEKQVEAGPQSAVEDQEEFDGPVIRGRVVSSSGAALLSRPKIFESFQFGEHGGRMIRGGARSTGDGGLFVIECPERTDLSTVLEITVSAHDNSHKKKYRLAIGEMQQEPWGWQAGDLRLSSLRSLDVLVQDMAGNPIPGAIAFTVKEQRLESGETNELGMCKLDGVEESVLLVGAVAIGYGEAHVPVAAEGATVVALAGSNQLAVEVLDVRGQPDEGLQLHLISKHPMFFDDQEWPAMAYKKLEASGMGGATRFVDGADVTLTSLSGRASQFLIFDLKPDVPFRLEVQDTFGHVLASRDLEGLTAREHRDERFQVEDELVDLRGRVLGHLGEVARCAVTMMGGSGPFRKRPDGEGKFSFDGVGSKDVWLRVESGDYALLDYRGEVPKGGDLGDLVLEPTHSLLIRVVDTRGANLKAHVMTLVEGMDIGDRQHSKLSAAGLNELTHLASGDIAFDIRVGGLSYERTIRLPRSEPYELELPVHGGVEVFGLDALRQNRKVGWRVYLSPLCKDSVLIAGGLRSGATSSLLEPILPGRYHLRLQEWQPPPTAAYKDIVEPYVVEVVADQVTRVEL